MRLPCPETSIIKRFWDKIILVWSQLNFRNLSNYLTSFIKLF
ncbi:hypothetical protein GXM_00975 [Nostoc sphaeroides CCNUC1]|uniref:Uncharacterized protein n=1 Tax=Nostoc sphaeroides CCNUC1 TaxID=2653204 RepID=A0A5P8VSZ0_9NOSO|nr:hypothetical protein GXM_00975 [Nostoc sphaeroides CCNUC1]